jgi:hypothetical protein
MGTPSVFSQGTLAVDDSDTSTIGDFDANSFRYEVESESLAMRATHVNAHGIRATRSRVSTRTRIGQEVVSGNIVLCPTPVELDQWLPRILGAAESTDVFALAETVPAWSVLVDRIAKRFIYKGCYVDKAVFSWSAGQMLKMTISAEGKSETISATSVPGTVPAINSGVPYASGDCTFSLSADASAAEVQEVEITIDNMLEKNRFMNSVTRAQLPSLDRLITVRMVVPYTADEVDLLQQTYAGAAGSVTFTLSGVSCAFAFGNLKCPSESPVISSRNGELMLNLNMTSHYVVGGARELVVTNDSAP